MIFRAKIRKWAAKLLILLAKIFCYNNFLINVLFSNLGRFQLNSFWICCDSQHCSSWFVWPRFFLAMFFASEQTFQSSLSPFCRSCQRRITPLPSWPSQVWSKKKRSYLFWGFVTHNWCQVVVIDGTSIRIFTLEGEKMWKSPFLAFLMMVITHKKKKLILLCVLFV